eukprot:366140-Chlamydomonas_euryale.AAC.1
MRKKGVGPVKTQSRRAKTRQDAPQTGGQFPECNGEIATAAKLGLPDVSPGSSRIFGVHLDRLPPLTPLSDG